MTLQRARVIRTSDASLVAPLHPASAAPASGEPGAPHRARRIPKQVVDAAEQADKLIRNAEARALVILEDAQRRAAESRLQAKAQGHADAMAELAARFVALRSHEAHSQQTTLAQQIELAKLLAQRLLGEELSLHPERVRALALQALREAKGARSIVIEAHPADAELLEQSLDSLGVAQGSAQVRANPERQRGDLMVITEAGVLDAALTPQLERLAQKLQETLNS